MVESKRGPFFFNRGGNPVIIGSFYFIYEMFMLCM